MKNILFTLLLTVFCAFLLIISLRGVYGNPTEQDINNAKWKDEGPLELSPDRGRFALTFSLIENNSFYFTTPIARFATPDLGYSSGHYVSLFAPGVSYLVIPGYLIGKYFYLAQVGSFAIIALFALFNTLLVRNISKKLGASETASTISALAFLFATPAFAYAVALYQHHISTFLILASIYVLLRWKNVASLAVIWFLAAASIPIDYPNLFLMMPIGLFALGRIIIINAKEKSINLNIKLLGFLTFFAVILPLAFFMWFNKNSYGNSFQFSGTVASVKAIDHEGRPATPGEGEIQDTEKFVNPNTQKKSTLKFFNSRNLLKGFNIHFISPDRGILFFTPIILFGLFGAYTLYKKHPQITSVLFGIVGTNILLYSMWGDPYGGWAFGSRYLIPTYSIMAIFIAAALTRYRRNFLLLPLFLILTIYSVAVNTLGAVTTNRNPPKVEAIALERLSHRQEKYSYDRNIDVLKSNLSKSYFFNTYASKYLTAASYYWIITALISITFLGLTSVIALSRKETKDD